MSSHKSRTALITGASAGIGEAFARECARRGYNLILNARRTDRLRELAGELSQEYAVQASIAPADLASDEGITALEERIRTTADLALLVNNAGFGVDGGFMEREVKPFADMVIVHDLAPVRLMHAAIPVMEARGGGAMINVSSIASFITRGGGSPTYSASKQFLNSFSQNLQPDLRDKGITLQALCPGYTYTEFHQSVRGADGDGKRPSLPGWMWQSADEVVRHSLDHLNPRRVVVVPGWHNKLTVFLMRTPLGSLTGTVRRWIKRG